MTVIDVGDDRPEACGIPSRSSHHRSAPDVWDDFQQEMRNAGVDKWIAEYSRQYDAMQ